MSLQKKSKQEIIEDYKKHIRKPSKNQVVRLDSEHFEYIEIIRAIYGNDFVTPNTNDIIKNVLKYYVTKEIKEDDVKLAIEAFKQVYSENKTEE